jgi:hypothetical protein
MLKKNVVQIVMALVATTALAATTVLAKDELPTVSHDGLHLMPDTKLRAVYMMPGADLSQYDKVTLLDTYVAFRKNWQRDHNEQESFGMRVSVKDMKEITERVTNTADFDRVLRRWAELLNSHLAAVKKSP